MEHLYRYDSCSSPLIKSLSQIPSEPQPAGAMDVRHLPLKNIITQSRKLPCPTPCPRLPVKRSIAHGTRFYMRGSHTISAPLPRSKLSSRSSWQDRKSVV